MKYYKVEKNGFWYIFMYGLFDDYHRLKSGSTWIQKW